MIQQHSKHRLPHPNSQSTPFELSGNARVPRGVTLVELLVVVSIVVVLAAVAVPVLRPAIADRQVREAARQLNSYIAAAQARAVELDRPVGVILERLEGNPAACLQVYIAEQPIPYAGDFETSRASIREIDSSNPSTEKIADLTGVIPLTTSLKIVAGDFIKFDYKGLLYPITRPPSDGPSEGLATVFFSTVVDAGTAQPKSKPPYIKPNVVVPFQIFRRPRKTSSTPLQMPSSTAIDLVASGITARGTFPYDPAVTTAAAPITIMFTPGGRIDRIYGASNSPQYPLGSIHLLVGRIDQVQPDNPLESNLSDPASRWVSISNQTGLVSTAENRGGTNDVTTARAFALDKQSMGGR